MVDAGSGVPEACGCGKKWTWRAPWWASPAAVPVWGYLVHCPAGHFAWFAAELSEEEREAALRRFGVDALEGSDCAAGGSSRATATEGSSNNDGSTEAAETP